MSGELQAARTRVIGIKFTEESLVPIVILKASGDQADQLIDEAKHEAVPIVRAPSLTSHLYRIPLDNAVTPDLFPMMAALLAHVIHVDRQQLEGTKNG